MPWYGWTLIGFLLAAVIGLLVSLIFFNKKTIVFGLTKEEKEALILIEKERIDADLQLEKKRTEELLELTKELRVKLTTLNEWYKHAKHSIDQERQREFENFVSDSDLIDIELDRILSSRNE